MSRATPLVEIGNNLFLKLESYLPTGSIKYRMVQTALAREENRRGTTVVVPSSGNTAAAAALWAKANGVDCVVVVPERCPVPKRSRSETLGAQVLVAPKGVNYRHFAHSVVAELAESYPQNTVWTFDQYVDLRNAAAYEKTLAPELARQARAVNLDSFAIALTASTGGTLLGLSRWFNNPSNWNYGKVYMALAEPSTENTCVDGAAKKDNISLVDARSALDMCVPVSDTEALRAWQEHSTTHNFGMSGGMALAAALRVKHCLQIPVVAICADNVSNY